MERAMFEPALKKKTEELEAILYQFLPEEKGHQKTVLEAMNYSVTVGGKRLRPMLMWETFCLCGGEEDRECILKPFLAAIEMIHTYSLVHDDLPAMDNDEYRRGKKTTWAVYGEACGILAGDGLLNFAFETALKAFDCCKKEDIISYQLVADALKVLAEKAGIYGMIGGQTADVEAEGDRELMTEERILFIHEHKTAALIQAAMMVGAILAGADKSRIQAMEKCAYNIGIAFQIQDDILDVIGDEKELGKPVGSDAENEKQTYVTLHGIERSKEVVKRLSEEALEILEAFENRNEFLEQLIIRLIDRRK